MSKEVGNHSRRRQWHPIPVLLPGKFHGRRSLVGCSPWGRKESDHDWATDLIYVYMIFLFMTTWVFVFMSLWVFVFMSIQYLRWRRKWYPTPVLLPGKSHGWRSLEGCSPCGRWGFDTTEQLHFHFSLSCIGEGNGSPLQCSCLENPRDGEAW